MQGQFVLYAFLRLYVLLQPPLIEFSVMMMIRRHHCFHEIFSKATGNLLRGCCCWPMVLAGVVVVVIIVMTVMMMMIMIIFVYHV
jgi:hypothetical protein